MRYKIFRLILGKTQKEIARVIGFSQQFWADLEKGTKKMKNTTLDVLMQKFGVNPDWLEGKTHILFIDWQKGLEILKGKSTLTRWELLFLLDVMHWVWSMPLTTKCSQETRKDFVSKISQAVRYLLSHCEILNLNDLGLNNALKLFNDNIFESLNAIERNPIATPAIAREITSILIGILRDGNFEMTKTNEQEISDLLLPWGYYVALSYLPLKQDLVPLSSIYFIWDIPFNEKEKNEKTIENLLSSIQNPIQKENVYIEFREYAKKANIDILFVGKGKITLNIEEAFGFFTMVLESQKHIEFSVLRFSIYERNITIDKKTTIMLTKNEYDILIEIVREIEKNRDFWMCLQEFYLEKYGFV